MGGVTSQKVEITSQWAAGRQGRSFFRSGQIDPAPQQKLVSSVSGRANVNVTEAEAPP